MKDYMGIISLNEKEDDIKDLTYNRPIAAIPIAGRYRVIDFTLSNLVNAQLANIGIFTQNKYRALVDHLGTGKAWDLDRKNDGLFVLNPAVNYYTMGTYRGDIENLKNNIDYIHLSKQKNVVFTSSYMICKVNYEDAIKQHRVSGADITIIYKKVNNCTQAFHSCHTLNIDETGKVLGTDTNMGKRDTENISMEMFIMSKALFLDILYTCVSRGDFDLFKDAVHKYVNRFNVRGYEYKGYLSCINSIQSYYRTNMELLDLDTSREVFLDNGLIYTKIKDEAPARYAETANVSNSMIANGCIIEGAIENSIIFRGVKVEKGAVIKNSILMQNCKIAEGASLDNVILDKNVIITKNKQLKGDDRYPVVIEKKMTI